MDKKQAQALIKETFESTFDKGRFVSFVKNLLNNVEEATFIYKGNYIPDAYEQYINTLERIGKYTDGEHKIDVLIAKLKKETSIERARTMQRNFVAWYLNGSRGGELKDAALVAFVAPNEEDWRFSLVKMDYRFEEGKSGRMRVKEEFTPARRWSFLVGVNENSHTAQSQLVDLVADDERNPVFAQLEEAFNIEKVTREFFEKYRELFLWTKETLDDTVKKDKKIREDFEAKGVDTVDFSKKLLGQIVFLYFLQKKGWFGVKRDADWGTGPKNFLRELFEGKHGSYKNFFNDILEPLFYEALARERDDDFYSRFNCKIPFLNGGLFDPVNNYDWVHTDILLPNDLFSNSYKTKEGDKGNGILDIFDRYNFTVKEDEPLEKEVAVDPEMLGKVFENLLEVKDRKSKGTYYTPREIVHYMCVQSLLNYLATELEGKVLKEDCEKLIKYGESVGENEAWVEKKGEETQRYYYKLPESIRDNAKLIDDRLVNIKVCDPAIGSGAFPVGMMTEIVRIRKTLSSYIKDPKRTLYNFKWDCIHNSLYGVDIDPSAVEIAKLRLWLSLVVDEEDIRQIKPLPNLDYKIMQGNSLLEEYEGVRLFDDKLISTVNLDKEKQVSALKEKQAELSSEYIRLHQADKLTRDKKQQIDDELKKINAQIKRLEQSGKRVEENASLFDIYSTAKKKSDELKRLHKEFFETTQKGKKDELKRQIERLEWDLIEATLKEQNKTSELKKLEELKKANIKPFFLWKLHFSEVFQEKGGFDVVIANPPYVSVKEIKPKDKKTFSQVFETGQGRFNLFTLFLEKGNKILKTKGILTFILPEGLYSNVEYQYIRKYLLDNATILFINLFTTRVFDAAVDTSIISTINDSNPIGEFPVLRDLKEEIIFLQQSLFRELPFFMYTVNLDNDSKHIVFKILNSKIPTIRDILEIQQGIIYSGQPKEKVFANEMKTEKYKKVLDGRDVLKWLINWKNKNENKFIHYTNKLHRAREERLFLAKEKILLPRKSMQISCAYDDEQYFCLNTAYVCLLRNDNYKLKFILAILNSSLINYCYSKLFFGWQITIPALDCIGIPDIRSSKQDEFIETVDRILSITKSDNYLTNTSKQAKVKDCERQIDQMVYELYGLAKEEIKIVEGSDKGD